MGSGRILRTPLAMVRDFHAAMGQPVRWQQPQLVDSLEEKLRIALIREEFEELETACAHGDLVGIADALGDLVYVIYGMALYYGIDLDAVVEEIHRSNMTKRGKDGKVRYREDGKVLKPDSYEPPDLRRVLGL